MRRDFTRVDAATARLTEALEREADLKPGVLEQLERELATALSEAALGSGTVWFSPVFRARPHGRELLDFVRYVRARVEDMPSPWDH
jgi:hypothetical protein